MWQDLHDVRPSRPRRHAPLHGKSHPESPSKTAGPYSISLTHRLLADHDLWAWEIKFPIT